MRSNEYLDRFGKHNAVSSPSDAEQRAMRLRDALLTPKGGRGRNAPHLEPIHMARLLISLTASATAPNAVSATIEYANMRAIGDRWFDGAEDFEIALTAIFSDMELVLKVEEVIVCRSWPEASIILKDGRKFTFSTDEPPEQRKQVCRIDYRVGWQFFDNILSRLETESRPKPSKVGWDRALKIQEIERKHGEDAADAWAKENTNV